MLKDQLMWDAGSFRDPTGSVFFVDESVYRSISEKSLSVIAKLIQTDFFKRYMADGLIIPTDLVVNEFNIPGSYVLQHEKIPFFSYPYEWSFYMLKDSALLTLDILKKCLENGYILKDGSAWNVTYHCGKMVFFDVLSIDTYEEGQTWDGYQQFCNEFLYPLFIKAYKDMDFQQIFKGSLSGIGPVFTRKFFKMRDIFKPGVFKHVFLNAILASSKKVASSTVKNRFKLPKVALLSIVDSLIKIVKPLECHNKQSIWIDYACNNTYANSDESEKMNFIKDFSDACSLRSKIVDLGCNTGGYSLFAGKSHNVISCDIDSSCIDALYKHVSANTSLAITPLVLNLMNPSSSSGWDLQERKSILERLQVNSFFSLALIHHICIANNVPLERFIQFLRKIAPKGVLEWVDKKDPMVQFLLRNRSDIFPDYTWENFENIVNKYFVIKKIQSINNDLRKLCWLEELILPVEAGQD
ncbi:MAG: hypothetical protein KKE11_03375 [Gammaproteobacteria bacterium]|nr:hypothetical protein [Gammaproteobacteria bacterium]